MDSRSPLKPKLGLGLPIKRGPSHSLFNDNAKRLFSTIDSRITITKPVHLQRQMLPVYKVKRR